MTKYPRGFKGVTVNKKLDELVKAIATARPAELNIAAAHCEDRGVDFAVGSDERPLYRELAKLLRGANK